MCLCFCTYAMFSIHDVSTYVGYIFSKSSAPILLVSVPALDSETYVNVKFLIIYEYLLSVYSM